ncbi:MAG: type II secretion system F family protein [Halobacteriovoraceae bacterium]|nr:type II secretion system F family protein [Halobacteriovoraceae bacterium]
MGNWRYEAINKDGKREAGTVQASNAKEVRRILRGKGLRPKRVTPPSLLEFDIGEYMVEKGLAKPFGAQELLRFTKQLAIMVNAGVPIIQSLEILYKQQKHPVLRRAIKRIGSDVGEGKTIAEAMLQQKGFDKLYCNLVKAGEAGGILDTILNKLTDHLEKQEKIKSQIKSAMTYPIIVTLVGIGVVWGLMVFVVPQFVGMLTDTGKAIPAITQFVIDASDFLGAYSMYMVPGFLMAAFIINSYIKTPSGKYLYDISFMRLPIFGDIIIKGNLSSFSRTLSTMLGSGVSLVDALDICIETIDNALIGQDLTEVRKKVIEGKTLTEPLEKISYFPAMVTQMIRVGEQTGQVDQMLEKIADVFEDEVEELIGTMTKMIEPLIIVVLGGIIATILIAMYLPMFMSAGG